MAKQGSLPGGTQSGLTELWARLRFVLLAIIVYRIGAHIPVPGINPDTLAQMFSQNEGTILSLFNMFSGGALERMSVLALGIMPYISASIIMQLLTVVSPQLEQLKKEGEAGRRKISQYTRYGTVLLATIQGFGITVSLANQGVTYTTDIGFYFTAVTTFVTGSVFLMWLGEQVTERGIGNGISILIFSGIVAGLPRAIGQAFESARQGNLEVLVLLLVALIAVVVIGFVVFVERGQRRITVNYAKRQHGRKVFAAQSSHLPLKVNMAGVIPAIFASSILLFPASIAQWFGTGSADAAGEESWAFSWLQDFAHAISPGQPLNIILFSAGIIFFCFFYTALVFNPKEVSDNLKRSGAYIPGIRPGEQSARYIDGVLTRLTMFGALYMTAVCLLPQFLNVAWNVPFYLGGTSLLIVVVVVMDFMSQVQSHLMSHQYESLMKKSNLKGFGSGGLLR
ncbi:preprotein translocase subunit SecY [Zooshikella sp. RANM57]|uniref:preprotein translocase subunit SecY n=1 Tax=Zooshikella sp. RANM57 TaxID=3425863 RepID=UPI003D6F6C09